VTARRERDWLPRYLIAPDRVRAEGDATVKALFAKYGNIPLANLGLDRASVDALIAYLEARNGARHDPDRH
jgi:hypothetical protein